MRIDVLYKLRSLHVESRTVFRMHYIFDLQSWLQFIHYFDADLSSFITKPVPNKILDLTLEANKFVSLRKFA